MGRILVVDDSPTARSLVSRTLEGGGFEVLVAGSGFEGLQLLRTHPEVTLALVDVNLPDLDGLRLLHLMRLEGLVPKLPVLMLTAETEGRLVEQAKQNGAAGWLVKPFRPSELVARVRSALARVARSEPAGQVRSA